MVGLPDSRSQQPFPRELPIQLLSNSDTEDKKICSRFKNTSTVSH